MPEHVKPVSTADFGIVTFNFVSVFPDNFNNFVTYTTVDSTYCVIQKFGLILVSSNFYPRTMKVYTRKMGKIYLALSLSVTFSFNNLVKAQSEIWGLNSSGGSGFGTIYGLPTGSTGIATTYNLVGYPGSNPQYTKLCQHGTTGKLYGMTNTGGANGIGVIFEYDTATSAYTRKIDLVSINGANPKGALMQAANNKFYGMTQLGGANGSGVIFEYDAALNTYTKKIDFTGTTGAAIGSQPWGTMIEVSGKLYGMTRLGGANNIGVLFEYNYSTNAYTKLFDFTGTAGSFPGSNPLGQLCVVGTKLYGLTSLGGANNIGVLFEYDYTTSTYVLKYDMVLSTGSTPQGSLTKVGSKLYGMATFGGSTTPGGGVIFEYDYGSSTYTKLTDLLTGAGNGANPTGELMLAANGKLYGLTRFGGASNAGALFEYDLSGPTYTKKADFVSNAAVGGQPLGSLIQVNTGKVYGLTSNGGVASGGVLFQYNISNAAYAKKVDLNSSDGGTPNGHLIQASNGKLYGLASVGGTNNVGVIFEWDKTSSTYTKKIDLISSTHGSTPMGSLLQATNNILYGVTSAGGTSAVGTLFEYNPSTNAITKRVDFTGNAGTNPGGAPYGALIQATNGKLYGMTKQGGSAGQGVIFEFDPSTNAYSKKVDLAAASGYSPTGAFVEASNGKLYALMQLSSGTGFGAIIEYDPGTTSYTKKQEFTGTTGLVQGSNPTGSMLQISAGILYGMTKTGGANGQGVIFEYNVTTDTYTKKYDLTSGNGSQPFGSLIKAANGLLYGVTNQGGANSLGALFEYDITSSSYTKKIDFTGTNGSFPAYTQLLEVCTKPITPGSITSSTNTLCETSSANLTFSISSVNNATSYTWTIPAGGSIISGGATTNLTAGFAGAAPATYTLGVAGVNICGTGTLSVSNITVYPRPNISVNSGAICSGKSFTIAPTGANTYTPQGGSFVVSPSSNSTYTVAGTSSFGCLSANIPTASVTVNALPTVSANSGTICSGSTFIITPLGASTYTLNGGGSGTSFPVSPTGNTNYSITGTDGNNCVSSNTAISSITVYALPVISINHGTICLGKTHTFTPGGANTYTITGGATGTAFPVSPSGSTTYTIAGTSTAGCISASPVTGSVQVNPLPTITANSGSICVGGVHTFIPGGASNYTITGGATGTSFPVSPTTSTSYTIAGTSSLGCVSSVPATGNVVVYSLPTITVNHGTICLGGTHTFTPGGANTYTITGGANGTSFPVSPPSSSTYTIAGTSSVGCVSSSPATGSVLVNSLPTVSVNSGTVCLGKTFTLVPSGASTYTLSGGGSGTTFPVSPATNTNYAITGTSSLGCVSSNTANASVTVIQLPVVSATNGAICIGSVFNTSVSGASTYTYAASAFSVSSAGSVTLNPASTTAYSVTGTSSVGCVSGSPAIMTVTVNPLPPVSISGPTAVCDGSPATLTANGAVNYNWGTSTNTVITVTPNVATVYTVQGTDQNSCSNIGSFTLAVNLLPTLTLVSGAICPGNSYTFTPGGAVTYTFSSGTNIVSPSLTTTYSVIGTDGNGCVSSIPAVATVSVVNILTVTITGNTTICSGGTVFLTANGASTYTWNTGDPTYTLSQTPTVGTSYTVIGASGTCYDTTFVSVQVNPLPSLSLSSTTTSICLGEPVTLLAGGANSYTWNTAETTTVIIVTPSVSTGYTVAGTNSFNCTNMAFINITVEACVGLSQNGSANYQYLIYPNPNSGQFVIDVPASVDLTVLNALGQVVIKQQLDPGKNEIDLHENVKGIYFVQLKQDNHIKTIKVVKQ
jgi:uncharacterized repeat protein (TIGR03803 family)